MSGRFTDGDWTKACKFIRVGNIVFYTISLTAADSTPMAGGSGEATFTLPVTSVTLGGTATLQPIGDSMSFDANGTRWEGKVYWATTTTAHIRYSNVSGSGNVNAALSSTTPFTWTTSDEITAQGFYQAAA